MWARTPEHSSPKKMWGTPVILAFRILGQKDLEYAASVSIAWPFQLPFHSKSTGPEQAKGGRWDLVRGLGAFWPLSVSIS